MNIGAAAFLCYTGNMARSRAVKEIPDFFKPVLWSYDFSQLDYRRDKKTIIVQTLNYGRWPHWQWIAKSYGVSTVRRILKETPVSEFRPPALRLAKILFGVSVMPYASRSAYVRSSGR